MNPHDLLAHARSWTLLYRSQVAFVKRHAADPYYWPAAWAQLEEAVAVTGPQAWKKWREYRAAKETGQ